MLKKYYLIYIIILLQISPSLIKNLFAQEPYFVRIGLYNVSMDESFSELAFTEALNLWVKTMQDNSDDPRMRQATINLNYYKTANELTDGIKNSTFEYLDINSVDYFDYNLSNYSDPFVIPSQNADTKFEKYLLVEKSGNPVKDLSELKDTKIYIPNSPSAYLMKAWIKVYLKENLNEESFNSIEIVDSKQNEATTLLAVFFKKYQFAVTRQSTYDFSCEINPQLKKGITSLAVSKEYVSIFFVERKGVAPDVSKAVFKHIMDLPKTPRGRQMLDIMQINQIFPIAKGDLIETEKLLANYKKYFK